MLLGLKELDTTEQISLTKACQDFHPIKAIGKRIWADKAASVFSSLVNTWRGDSVEHSKSPPSLVRIHWDEDHTGSLGLTPQLPGIHTLTLAYACFQPFIKQLQVETPTSLESIQQNLFQANRFLGLFSPHRFFFFLSPLDFRLIVCPENLVF